MLKKVLFVFISLLFAISSLAIDFEKDYKTAVKKAKENNLPLLVMISSPSCPECNYMKKNVFTQKDVKNYLSQNFISFEFHIDDKDIPKQMQFWGIPRFYFSKDGENVYNKTMGGLKTDKFLALLKESSK